MKIKYLLFLIPLYLFINISARPANAETGRIYADIWKYSAPKGELSVIAGNLDTLQIDNPPSTFNQKDWGIGVKSTSQAGYFGTEIDAETSIEVNFTLLNPARNENNYTLEVFWQGAISTSNADQYAYDISFFNWSVESFSSWITSDITRNIAPTKEDKDEWKSRGFIGKGFSKGHDLIWGDANGEYWINTFHYIFTGEQAYQFSMGGIVIMKIHILDHSTSVFGERVRSAIYLDLIYLRQDIIFTGQPLLPDYITIGLQQFAFYSIIGIGCPLAFLICFIIYLKRRESVSILKKSKELSRNKGTTLRIK